jgi:hypothetical protein
MNDSVIAQLRTVTPGIVGALIAWAAGRGIDIDPATEGAFVVAATGIAVAVWRFIFGKIEKHFPSMGWLLGYPKQPVYTNGPTVPLAEAQRMAEDAATEAYRQIEVSSEG